jgi:HAD superfamily hydrolase (TIGR01509 family)
MHNAPNEQLFKFIAEDLKPKYKIGLLSNTGRDRLGELFTTEELALFDDLSLSYESGYLKPQPEAYLMAAERLGVVAGGCIFIDDQDKRCVGARNAGMYAILYQDFTSMKTELQKLLDTIK